jgi:aldehyde:ferredoxin oxidoreductase
VVTGREISEQELYRIGERVFNLQRAILAREGHFGKDEDQLPETWYDKPLRGDPTNPECLVPGKNGEALSRKGAVVDRADFERTRDEYYRLRGWDPVTGLQSGARLEELGLIGVADGLSQKRLARD